MDEGKKKALCSEAALVGRHAVSKIKIAVSMKIVVKQIARDATFQQ
ncbi:hypothetical protein E2C01_049915 [Portunus trituberculatus]|uniref:Uncharacterized protein n=1 Tax=Portunus trituberculatus TaxID=210409 RepID=A0A5B7GF22_PORTR|nr:hypothetical protein [Portunus trituberculatus]